MKTRESRQGLWLGLGVVSAGLAATAWLQTTGEVELEPQVQAESSECPDGYRMRDPVEYAREFNANLSAEQAARIRSNYGERSCSYSRLPESIAEIGQWGQVQADAAAAPLGRVPQNALRDAVAQKAAMKRLQAKVGNADGRWEEYGRGPQVSDQDYGDGSKDGIPSVAGRVDDFAYDAVRKRLFAAVGTGGIWMSEAVDGDVATLADHWEPIGDNLPTLINSAVAWTEAGGGRVLALSGEHVQGGNTYTGLGAFWSDDLGLTWHQADGIPDGAGASALVVDLSNQNIVYAGTHRGLFRSDDGGKSYVNVELPVSEECAGVFETTGACQLANVVSDVVIRQPGGRDATTLFPTVCSTDGCGVLVAVGYRGGSQQTYADGTPIAPGNGLYRSETGQPGSFTRLSAGSLGLSPAGFAPQERIGRVELGVAIGPEQDHNIVYAIVQDALLFNDGIPVLDLPTEEKNPQLPLDCGGVPDGDPRFVCDTVTAGFNPTAINGIYASTNFGTSWVRLADDMELTYNPTTGSTLAAVVPLGIGPGVQAWYDLWIQPDPTLADLATGAPTRVAFGMEEIWLNRLAGPQPVPVLDEGVDDVLRFLGVDDLAAAVPALPPVIGLEQTNNDWRVIGTYFAGETCLFLVGNIGPGVPLCPTYDGIINGTTTHPDQHDAIYVPDDQRGGVWLIAGNDGGVYKQYSADPITDNFANNKWGDGANQGFYTLMNYGIDVSADGTVFYGLQDNASGKIEPNTRRQVRTYVGDGVWVAVHPTDSSIAYVQTPGLSINRTTDGGRTHDNIAPDGDDPGDAVGVAHFLGPFMMDPQNPEHLVASGTRVAELIGASTSDNWVTVFDLGVDEASGALHQTRHRPIDVEGANVYVGWCGPCSILEGDAQFQRGIATNVGGKAKPRTGTASGWHQASVNGLPNRFIYGIEMDPQQPETVYVALGGYSTARWLNPGGYLDENMNIGSGHVFKSVDAGENFVDISGNLPDTNVTAILKRGNQLIVGTDIGVFISSDLEGSEWAPLGDLPNVPVNQLVLQPGNAQHLFAGTFGRGVQRYVFADELPARALPTTGEAANDGMSAARGGASGPALLLLLGLVGLRRRRC